mgnify:CR=1 FL=1
MKAGLAMPATAANIGRCIVRNLMAGVFGGRYGLRLTGAVMPRPEAILEMEFLRLVICVIDKDMSVMWTASDNDCP